MNRRGFTIIELMIATLVFSTILILLSVGLIQIARVYYKGLTTSRTQQTARGIMDDITRNIQFDGGNVIVGANYFCVNNNRYTYQLNAELVDGTPDTLKHQANHVLIRDTDGSCSGPANFASLNPGATELLATNMRLANLTVTRVGASNLYTIVIRVVAGDDDLLDLTSPTTAFCKGGSGSQFCAVSELQSTVDKRI